MQVTWVQPATKGLVCMGGTWGRVHGLLLARPVKGSPGRGGHVGLACKRKKKANRPACCWIGLLYGAVV